MLETKTTNKGLAIFYDTRSDLHNASSIHMDTAYGTMDFQKTGFKVNLRGVVNISYDSEGLTWIEIENIND